MRLKLTVFVLETKISPRNRQFQGQRCFEDFFSLFFLFLAHQWCWKVISSFRLCKEWNVTLTVDFQGQGYLSDFFPIQSIKLRRKILWNPRFHYKWNLTLKYRLSRSTMFRRISKHQIFCASWVVEISTNPAVKRLF